MYLKIESNCETLTLNANTRQRMTWRVIRPSLRDLFNGDFEPTLERVGYSRISLREIFGHHSSAAKNVQTPGAAFQAAAAPAPSQVQEQFGNYDGAEPAAAKMAARRAQRLFSHSSAPQNENYCRTLVMPCAKVTLALCFCQSGNHQSLSIQDATT